MLLRAEHVSSSYGRIVALHDVSMCIEAGEFVALIGANGAGKTTFLNLLSGVQPLRSGRIEYEGMDLRPMSPSDRVKCGIVQSPEGRQIFSRLSVRDNLELGGYTRPRGGIGRLIESAFDLFPVLASRQGAIAGTLSGGEQQMLAIGRALMSEPSLLLLDEPSLGLAPQMTSFIFDKIRGLNAKGMSILLVEQNASIALDLADRAYVMETGAIVLSGTGQELIGNAEVQSAYLGM